jgi:hypothetical protein
MIQVGDWTDDKFEISHAVYNACGDWCHRCLSGNWCMMPDYVRRDGRWTMVTYIVIHNIEDQTLFKLKWG